MSYVPEVTARWKRRATEIADAIGGGESSSTVSGTVSLSAASITALADAIDDRLRLSAIAVSIADVLSVKTNANDSVAVTGTVSATLPANLVIPVDTVAGTNNGANGSGVAVTVPVNAAHNVTIPVKTNSANQPMSSAGLPVSVPVDPVHSVTVPVKSNSSGQPLTLGNVVAQIGVAVGSTTVPVSVVTNTSQGASVYGTGVNVPVAGGLATIPVSNASGLTVQISNASGLVCDIANTNNVVVPVDTVSGTNNAANGSGVAVVVPVTASGTVLDLLIILFLVFLLFLVSEGLLFVSFFWTSFHSSASPSFGIWPGEGFYVPDPCELTFANTLLLSNAAISLGNAFISLEISSQFLIYFSF